MKNFILVLFLLSFIGCETFRGIGQDIENTGNNIKDVVGNTDDK